MDFSRHGKKVQEELISKPYILEKTKEMVLEHLPTHDGMTCRFNHAETFVIPALTQRYKLINEGSEPALMIKTFVK